MHLIQQVILRIEGLKKVFRSGKSDLVLFENLSFQVAKGEMLAIVGESGGACLPDLWAVARAISVEGHGLPLAFCTQNTYEPINVWGNRVSKSFQ